MNVENAFAKISDADIIALPTAQLLGVETDNAIVPVPPRTVFTGECSDPVRIVSSISKQHRA